MFIELVMTGPGPSGTLLVGVAVTLAGVEVIGAEEAADAALESVLVTGGRESVTPALAQVCWAKVRASVEEPLLVRNYSTFCSQQKT